MIFFRVFCFNILVIGFFFLNSCSQSKIEINTLHAKPIYVQGAENELIPRLSLFLTYTNTMGQNDFKRMEVRHKDTGLTWILAPDDVSFFKNNTLDENTFIVGTNKISFPYSELLSGEYVVSIYKLNLDKETQLLSLQAPDIRYESFPVLSSLNDKQIKLETTYEIRKCQVILLGVDMQAFYTQNVSVVDHSINVSTIVAEHKDAHYLQLLFVIDENDFLSKIMEIK